MSLDKNLNVFWGGGGGGEKQEFELENPSINIFLGV